MASSNASMYRVGDGWADNPGEDVPEHLTHTPIDGALLVVDHEYQLLLITLTQRAIREVFRDVPGQVH